MSTQLRSITANDNNTNGTLMGHKKTGIALAIPVFFCYSSQFNYGGLIGPLATIDREPRQARKGAAVTIDSGAEVWLLGPPPKCE